jgi:hypothetical protein
VAAVAAVVGGVALLGSGGGGTPDRVPVADDATTAPTTEGVIVGPLVRVETWRNLSLTVPKSWGYGNLSTWCLNGKAEPGTPVVERPGGVIESIACMSPENGYGVQFLDGSLADMAHEPGELWQYEPSDGKVYPVGAWLGYQRSADNLVLVVAPSRPEAATVLGSVVRLGEDDPDGNACLTRFREAAGGVPDGQVRLCRYDAEGWLEQSELMTGQDAVDATTALAAAPVGQVRRCMAPQDRARVDVTAGALHGTINLDRCLGFDWDGQPHELTADVLHWVLSPGWSGQVPDGITFEPRS